MARMDTTPHKNYRFTLDSAEIISGTVLNGNYSLQGTGLGGTIKRGAVYVKYFNTVASTGGTPFAKGTVGHMLKVKSNSFPVTDVQYKYSSGNKTINELDNTISIMKNNSGTTTGSTFAFDNLNVAEADVHKFQNWNPSQGLNIQITAIDDSAITASHITPYNMELVVIEYLDDVNPPGSLVNSVSNF